MRTDKLENENSTDIETIKTQIAKIQDPKDIELILRKVDKVEDLAAIDKDSLWPFNRHAEIRLRVARRAGEILANSPKNKGGRKGSDNSKEHIPTYEEQGISPMQASRFQRIYAIPLTIFEQLLAKLKEDGQQISDAYFLQAHADLFPSSNANNKVSSQKRGITKTSGEKKIDPTEMKSKMQYECPDCGYKMTKLHVVKSKEDSVVAA